jgi:hypothetical protein
MESRICNGVCKKPLPPIITHSDVCHECRWLGCDYKIWSCEMCKSNMTEEEHNFCDICPDCLEK